MRSRKGFTLIELMIVIIIVAILAAVVVPLLLSRVEDAKYTEGEAILGQVATVLRAHVAENGPGTYTLTQLGFKGNELDGKYFDQDDITLGAVTEAEGALTYTLTITPSSGGIDEVITLECIGNDTNISRASAPASGE